MEINKKELKKILKEQRKGYQNYIGVLKEDFDSKIDIIGEGNEIIKERLDKVSKRGDATFKMVGEMKMDMEVVKSDISFIKNSLKQKVDKDEFISLEKRVILLENKLKRV